MAALMIVALIGGYIIYTVWYSIIHDLLDAAVLILGSLALLSLVIWYESVVNCIA